jgi:hypothetical protein
MVQKFESDVRMHLRHQNFLKLHIDTLQHTNELQNKEITELKKTLKLTDYQKLKSEKLRVKEAEQFSIKKSVFEKEVSNLKERLSDLNMIVSSKNGTSMITMDKRDHMFLTLASNPTHQFSKAKIKTSKNESYKGKIL